MNQIFIVMYVVLGGTEVHVHNTEYRGARKLEIYASYMGIGLKPCMSVSISHDV